MLLGAPVHRLLLAKEGGLDIRQLGNGGASLRTLKSVLEGVGVSASLGAGAPGVG